jgi:hypothetical protein
MSDMRAYQVHLDAQRLANEMLIAHAKGAEGSYNVTLGLEAFGKLCAAVHALANAPPTPEATEQKVPF